MKFRKKPIVIEALQWTGDNAQAIRAFAVSSTRGFRNEKHGVIISTLEGEITANVGDWIIKGVKGEFYPCKPDVFDATYEPVNPPESEGIEAPQSNPVQSHQITEPQWIEWKGGVCPISEGIECEIKLRSAQVCKTNHAHGFQWDTGNAYDIIAYRVWPAAKEGAA